MLLWSLDGALRYLPIAALYDGKQYMAERFNNVMNNPASYVHLTTSPNADGKQLRALAMGLSKGYGGLPALPGVLPELEAVVHDPDMPASHGPMDGKLLPDDQFTLAALEKQLGLGGNYPVVHIASHFVFESGDGKQSYLMLSGENVAEAGGYALTLSNLADSPFISFSGTRLLTLSACSTAQGDILKDGVEMESMGMITQGRGADAVLASLWDVDDASTSQIMSDFYARWVDKPAEGKAEALRQAQLAFLHSSDSTTAVKSRGFRNPAQRTTAAPASGYSHPFYWAPFVLIGNYQ
jgi:CHAT domain-containing protein